jgi:replicative DNA helicase
MLQMAKSAAKAGFPATIFSLEMTKEELGKRLLFSTGKVKPIEIATGYVNEYGYEPAKEELQNLPIYVNDESRTLAGLLSRIIVSVSQGRCKIAFVDYLGLINIDETGRMPIKDQLAKATKELKNLAKRQKIPIVALAQLNREAAKEDGAPELYHLKDSGAIEQDADIVLMLENAKRIDEDVQQRPNINIWVRKNRQYRRDIKITVEPNDSYSAFAEVDENGTPATPVNEEPEEEQQEEDKELF